MSDYCTFCEIIAGNLPSTVIHREDGIIVFRNRLGWFPVQWLLVPTEHMTQPELWASGDLMARIAALAAELGEEALPARIQDRIQLRKKRSQRRGRRHAVPGARPRTPARRPDARPVRPPPIPPAPKKLGKRRISNTKSPGSKSFLISISSPLRLRAFVRTNSRKPKYPCQPDHPHQYRHQQVAHPERP